MQDVAKKAEILVVTSIPPELKARLSANYTLVEDRPKAGDVWHGRQVVVTTSMAGADAALMESLPDLRLIACNGTGLDKIDADAARRLGITVQHTPDVVTEDTADFAIGLIYATCRRIVEADRFVRNGGWLNGKMTPSRRISARRLGIVGLGAIGATIARRAAGLGMAVSYTGPREKPGSGFDYVSTPAELAAGVDILVLSCPGGAETRHLVNAGVLAALGPDGILINVSRGTVVDEEALIAALRDKVIAAAGLDVFANEPAIDSRLLTLENVVLQPHYAAVTAETREAMADILEAAIDRFHAQAGM